MSRSSVAAFSPALLKVSLNSYCSCHRSDGSHEGRPAMSPWVGPKLVVFSDRKKQTVDVRFEALSECSFHVSLPTPKAGWEVLTTRPSDFHRVS